ncbi:hypothetical protein D3C72_1619760 [compost metagenome]
MSLVRLGASFMFCRIDSQSTTACVGQSLGAMLMLVSMRGCALPCRASALMAAILRTSKSARGLQNLRSILPSTNLPSAVAMRSSDAAGNAN